MSKVSARAHALRVLPFVVGFGKSKFNIYPSAYISVWN